MVLSYSNVIHILYASLSELKVKGARKQYLFSKSRQSKKIDAFKDYLDVIDFQFHFYDHSIDHISESNNTRNRLFLVKNQKFDGLSILLKQPKIFDENHLKTFYKEVIFYSEIINTKLDDFVNYTPDALAYDYNNYILLRIWYDDYKSLREDMCIDGDKINFGSFFKNLGNAIYQLHSHLKYDNIDPKYYKILENEFPLFIFEYRPIELNTYDWFNDLENRNLISFFKDSTKEYLLEFIEICKTDWLKNQDILIHADLKFDNILVKSENEFFIIDWEMCMFGDNAWDISTILFELHQNYYKFYQVSLSLKRINFVFKSFLKSYDETSNEFKIRVVRYTGLKIIDEIIRKHFNTLNDIRIESYLAWGEELISNPSEYLNIFFE